MDIETKTTKSYTNLGSNVSSIQHSGTSGGANYCRESYSCTLNQQMIWMILVHWEIHIGDLVPMGTDQTVG